MKILFTGGSGLLGQHLVPLLEERHEVDAPSSKKLDITKPVKRKKYDLVIHAAAYTDVLGAETDKDKCAKVNIEGTLNLLRAYDDTPFVFISSEYAKSPVNYYARTKTIGELLVASWAQNYLIIRTLFKPRPFPWDRAFIDQYTQGDYVDTISELIKDEINSWNKKSKSVYVGTGRKSIYNLAKTTRRVRPMLVEEIEGVRIPRDYL